MGRADDDAAGRRAGAGDAARDARAARARARHRRGDRRLARRDRGRRRRRSATSTATSCAWPAATGTATAACPSISRPSSRRPGPRGRTSGSPPRAESNFAAFAPALRRNIDLARSYAAASRPTHPYDALLADYDFGLTVARAARGVRRAGRGAAAAGRRGDGPPGGRPPRGAGPAQEAAVRAALAASASPTTAGGVDVSAHPFTSWVGTRDIRLTTRYEDGQMESVLAAMHEFGHGLYERQIDPALMRTNLATGTSMSMHESQSKLWENHVGRHPAFAAVIAAGLGGGGFDVVARRPARRAGPGAAVADPRLGRPADLSAAHRAALRARGRADRGLARRRRPARGVERRHAAAARRRRARRRVRRAAGRALGRGAFGYFPSYALGVLIAAQLWERLEAGSRRAVRRRWPTARSARSATGSASTSTATAGAWTPSRSFSRSPGAGSASTRSSRHAPATSREPDDVVRSCPRSASCRSGR